MTRSISFGARAIRIHHERGLFHAEVDKEILRDLLDKAECVARRDLWRTAMKIAIMLRVLLRAVMLLCRDACHSIAVV
jgi:hypothetical protein